MKIGGVAECLCVEVTNSVLGSAAKLLVRLQADSMLNAREIRAILTKELDSYKVPSSIEFVSEIEKNAMGKPDRKFYQVQQ